jgi:DNA-binding MarR family transcriptional regulator
VTATRRVSPSPVEARTIAAEVLAVIPRVMRALSAELRASGELPAPAHFGLLTLLAREPSTASQLARWQGVSRPTMSNSIGALIRRGWARRTPSPEDRRVVVVDVTPSGRALVERVGRAARRHLAGQLLPLDLASARRLRDGLAVLKDVFAEGPDRPRAASAPRRRPRARA